MWLLHHSANSGAASFALATCAVLTHAFEHLRQSTGALDSVVEQESVATRGTGPRLSSLMCRCCEARPRPVMHQRSTSKACA